MSRYRPESAIDLLVIHSAGTPNGRWHTAYDLDEAHAARGFARSPELIQGHAPQLTHIAFHFVILTTGAVAVGRRLVETCPGTPEIAQRSLHTCLIGTDVFTFNQWRALTGHVDSLQRRFPGLRVIGWRELAPDKPSPGFDVPRWLAGNRTPLPHHLIGPEQYPCLPTGKKSK